MLTRRQLLLSAAVLGTPVAMALPLPGRRPSGVRLGLLQSQQPYIDPHDADGSRERAFTAYQSLARRSLEQHDDLEWLVGGALPLSGAGPFPKPVLAALALDEQAPEVRLLSTLAKTHHVRLTLGAWWRGAGNVVDYRLLSVDARGDCHAHRPREYLASENIQLRLSAELGKSSLASLATECARIGSHGAWVEMSQSPTLPPGVPPVLLPRSAIIDSDGKIIAQTGPEAESCLVSRTAVTL